MRRKGKSADVIRTVAYIVLVGKIITSNSIYDITVFMCAFFVHELCHFIVAKCAGVGMSLGGIRLFGLDVRMKDVKNIYKKLAVYSAGISANLLCAALCALYETITGVDVHYFMSVNLLIAFINMIPSFPLDGGRILCCVLGLFMREVKAVRITATVGDIVASVCFFFGIYVFLFYSDNILFSVLAVFMIYNNEREVRVMSTHYVMNLLNGAG